MRQTGSVIGIIAGSIGVFAAIGTFFVGAIAYSAQADGAYYVVRQVGCGFVLSILAIVFGAMAMNAHRPVPGCLLIVASLAGMMLGGPFVAICMVVALIGGILATIGASGRAHPASPHAAPAATPRL